MICTARAPQPPRCKRIAEKGSDRCRPCAQFLPEAVAWCPSRHTVRVQSPLLCTLAAKVAALVGLGRRDGALPTGSLLCQVSVRRVAQTPERAPQVRLAKSSRHSSVALPH